MKVMTMKFLAITTLFSVSLFFTTCNTRDQVSDREEGEVFDDTEGYSETQEYERELPEGADKDAVQGFEDNNGDNAIAENEFEESVDKVYAEENMDSEVFDEWDANQDKSLDEDELSEGAFTYFDDNENNVLEENEIDSYLDNYFSAWDDDNDGYLNEEELASGFDFYLDQEFDASYMDDWDSNNDNQLGPEEIKEGIFEWWDADDSGEIERDEFTV